MKTIIHISSKIVLVTFLGLMLQQLTYCLYTMQWLDFGSFTGSQLIFELLYVLSLVLVTMSEGIKVSSVEPMKTKKQLENTYVEI
jgi:hypothetical protein